MSDVDTFLQSRDEATPVEAAPVAEQAPIEPVATPTPVAPVAQAKPEPEPMTDKERAFMAAARDERNKRQDLERRLQEMEQANKAPPKEFWEAPEDRLNEFKADIQHTMLKTKIDMAESIARTRHEDFDEKVTIFADLLQNTPGLHDQWLAALDPAEFAYKAASNYSKFQESGSIDVMRTKIEAELRASIEAEYRAKDEAREKKLSAIPNSVSGINGTGASSTPVWTGPASLESLLA